VTSAQQQFASWAADLLVYVVVLNLFVEYVDTIQIDSFTISIFTAVLLRALLGLIVRVEHRAKEFFDRRPGRIRHVLGVVTSLAIVFFSKFFILEAVNVVFGDHVELHGFVEIVSLVVALVVTRRLVQWMYERLGPPLRDDAPEVAAG
jgi:hypothetical protein